MKYVTQIWYKTSTWNAQLEEVKVSKETEKQVEIVTESGHKRREGKVTDWGNYFKTKKEALLFLKDREEKTLSNLLEKSVNCQKNISELNEKLLKI